MIIISALLLTLISTIVQSHELSKDETAITAQAKAFSKAFVEQDVNGIMAIYSTDARIVYGRNRIENDIAAIRKYWTPNLSSKWHLQWHRTESEELIVSGNLASDIGYYSGLTKHEDGREQEFRGAYVIVWKKIDNVWRMHIDMWNSIK